MRDGAQVRGIFQGLDELYVWNYARVQMEALLSSMVVVEGDATSVVEIYSKDDASMVVGNSAAIVLEHYETRLYGAE